MKRILLLALLAINVSCLVAQKTMYIPKEWRNRTDTLIWAESDPDNKYTWSKSRSIESDNVIVLWDKGYGSTRPDKASGSYQVDIDDLLRKCEDFFQLEVDKLGFVDHDKSNLAKYKVMVLMNHTTEWTCYGGGYDFQVSALWLNPSTCKPVGEAVAHEVGHSFHYMCYAEDSRQGTVGTCQTGFHGAVGNGAGIWEQTAQWQALQSFPEQMYSESIGIFRNSHNYAFTHEWHRYQSYWFLYYINQHYNDIQTVAKVWNTPETTVKDFNEVLMDCKSLSVEDLYRLYYDYAARMATWDLDACAPYRDSHIGDFNYKCVLTPEGDYQVALASCPQSTGFNVIELDVPAAGTTVTTHFNALTNGATLAAGDPAKFLNGDSQWQASGLKRYNRVSVSSTRGFRLGYAALMQDGTRQYFNADSVYCTGYRATTEDIAMTVPAGVSRLWLIVSPAPSRYYQHRWDEKIDADDMWPYSFSLEGTDLSSRATVYVTPQIDGRDIADCTLTYDVTFPASATAYDGASIVVGGQAAATVGTALQFDLATINAKMQQYAASGPSAGKVMFYAVKPDGTLQATGSTANGYGHWFNTTGTACAYASGTVYSEFYPQSQTFILGQYPGKCKDGDSYTIRQALRYKDTAGHEAKAVFVFNIHIDSSRTGATLTATDYTDPATVAVRSIASATPQDHDAPWRTLSGTAVEHPTQRGIYIKGTKKIYVK